MLSRFAGHISINWIPACAGMTEYFAVGQSELILPAKMLNLADNAASAFFLHFKQRCHLRLGDPQGFPLQPHLDLLRLGIENYDLIHIAFLRCHGLTD